MKRLLAIVGSVIVCGAAIAGYQARHRAPGSRLWPAPQVFFDRVSLDFGTTLIGERATTSVVATNPGVEPVVLEAFRTKGAFRPLQGRVEIGPGEAAMLSFAFVPTRGGAHETEIYAQTPSRRIGALTLLGFAEQPPQISIEPRAVEFGPVVLGEERWTPLSIHNRGEGPLEISSLAGVGRFGWSSSSLTIPPNGHATVEATFRPTRTGPSEAQLLISSNDPSRPVVGVPVRGSGVEYEVVPSIEITPSRLEFGRIAPGRSARKWVEIRNLADDPLTITSVTVDGPVKVATRSRTIAPRGFVRLPVVVLPQAAGDVVEASLSFYSNDPASAVSLVEVNARVDGAGRGDTVAAVSSNGETDPWYAGTILDSVLGGGGGAGSEASLDLTPGSEAAFDAEGVGGTGGPEAGTLASATSLNVEDGSFVNLGSYHESLGSPNLDGASYDAAAGTITFEGLQLPSVNAALGESYSFSPADVVASVSAGGEVTATVPMQIFDEFGNPTVVQVRLTTDTATATFDGTEVAVVGSPLGPDGSMTLVALEKVPGGALEGQSLQLLMHVQVE